MSGWTTHPSKSSSRCRTAQWQRTRAKVMTRDDWQCQIRLPGCLVDATACDHIVPVAQCGTDDPDNCRAACKPCHDKKTASEAAAGRATNRRRRRAPLHPADTLHEQA